MKRFPKLSHLSDSDVEVLVRDDDTLFILEKVDGANFRWKLFNTEELLFGSRKVVFKENQHPQQIEDTNKQFRHAIRYLQETVDITQLQSITDEYGDLIFYGEAMHKHTVKYDWDGKYPDVDSKMPNYIGFDIWNETTEMWLSHSDVVEIHNRLGLETVPIIKQTTVSELSEEDIEIPQSSYRTPDKAAEDEFNRNGLAEGIVIKNDVEKVRAKKVSEYMKEVNQFGEPNEEETLEEMKKRKRNAKIFVNTFITEQRVLKNAHKLVDEGHYDSLQMSMMEKLPQRVLTDIFTEEGWAILNHEYSVELTEDSKSAIRQKASSRCAQILKENITLA